MQKTHLERVHKYSKCNSANSTTSINNVFIRINENNVLLRAISIHFASSRSWNFPSFLSAHFMMNQIAANRNKNPTLSCCLWKPTSYISTKWSIVAWIPSHASHFVLPGNGVNRAPFRVLCCNWTKPGCKSVNHTESKNWKSIPCWNIPKMLRWRCLMYGDEQTSISPNFGRGKNLKT